MFNKLSGQTFCSAAILSLAFTISAAAQSSNPAWVDDLELDLSADHECEVVEYLDMHEGELTGRNMYFAKVKCRDGREFEASRIEPKEEFDIRQCEIVSC